MDAAAPLPTRPNGPPLDEEVAARQARALATMRVENARGDDCAMLLLEIPDDSYETSRVSVYFGEPDEVARQLESMERPVLASAIRRESMRVGYLANFYLDPSIRGGAFALRCWEMMRRELRLYGVGAVWTHFGPDDDVAPSVLRYFISRIGFRPVAGLSDGTMPAYRLAMVAAEPAARPNPAMPAARSLDDLGAALRDVAASPEAAVIAAQSVYLDSGRPIDSFSSGGCFILAEAFARWVGPAAEILGWLTFDDAGAYVELTHVVVRVADRYFDADGAWTLQEARERFDERVHMGGWLGPFDLDAAESSGVGCAVGPMRAFLSLLREKLGAPARWGVPTEPAVADWARVTVSPARGAMGTLRDLVGEGLDAHSGVVDFTVRAEEVPAIRAALSVLPDPPAVTVRSFDAHRARRALPKVYRPRDEE
jgi:hypothetical protein